ncbi:hypothetical protein Sala_1772 [Sphingopyxis alaskensis RB2256]|uniref:Uncharacterized protein n=1 Tax=Sphingopyxis alaskensis (strain DSM 13593 / LMG 18877 / RB2256) TaxID=317655 RepID=Q1GS87_SPHAL|nr:hypothetical protein Sala_1772 [Sphingopyxis alaskensis RB2256]
MPPRYPGACCGRKTGLIRHDCALPWIADQVSRMTGYGSDRKPISAGESTPGVHAKEKGPGDAGALVLKSFQIRPGRQHCQCHRRPGSAKTNP